MTKTKRVLKTLNNCIDDLCSNPQNFIVNPERDFTRCRKLCLEKVIRLLLSMQNKSLSHELLDLFEFDTSTPTASAFVQQKDRGRFLARQGTVPHRTGDGSLSCIG